MSVVLEATSVVVRVMLSMGLVDLRDGKAVDTVVVDQFRVVHP